MEKEFWAVIPNYEGLYEASNTGKIRSLPRNTTKGFVLKACKSNRDGRPRVTLFKNGIRKYFQVHVLILYAFSGMPKEKQECRHLNGNKTDNNIENLVWGTKQENQNDKYIHKTMPYGEKHSSHKLTASDVIYIRSDESKHFTQQDLAKKFNVSQVLISRILLRKTWKHI